MSRGWSAALLASIVVTGSPLRADVELPNDLNICVSPIEWGDADAPPYAAIWINDRPHFIPGHPTPIFGSHTGTAFYIDRHGRLRTHPRPGPAYYDHFFLGSDGNVYWPRRSTDSYVFDEGAGYFRSIDAEEVDKQQQARAILAEIDAAPAPDKASSMIRWGVTSPTRSVDSDPELDGPASMTQRRSAVTPQFGLKVETEGDTLRLAWGNQSKEIELRFVGYSGWNLTELERSGQVLFESRFGRNFFLIDADLNLTVPDGDWRLSRPEAIYLPETGEAILTTGPNLPYLHGLFWLRDRRLSGPDACGDTAPPPEQAYRTIPPAGAEAIDTEHLNADVEPVWTGRSFLSGGANGVFEVPLDGPVRRLAEFPDAWTQIWQVPDLGLILTSSCDRFFLYDGAEVVYASGDLTGFFDRSCVQGLQPVAYDPGSGEIQLDRGWTVSVEGGLDKTKGVLSGISWTDWLNASPNPAQWPGSETLPNGKAVDPERRPSWWKLPRFGFAIRQDGKGRFVRMGADRVHVTEPGQPEGDDFTFDDIRLVFDPGRGDAIAVAANGRQLGLIAADGTVRPLDCAVHCVLGWINTLDVDPSDQSAVLIGAQAGLFRYAPDTGLNSVLPVTLTGPVFAVTAVRQIGETLIEAGFGRFVWSEEKGIRRLGPTGGALYPLRLFSPPGSAELFTATRIPARFEFLGND